MHIIKYNIVYSNIIPSLFIKGTVYLLNIFVKC